MTAVLNAVAMLLPWALLAGSFIALGAMVLRKTLHARRRRGRG